MRGARGCARLGRLARGLKFCVGALRGLSPKDEAEGLIAVLEEGALPAIAPLGDMVRDAGKNDAGQARHGSRIVAFGYLVRCHRNPKW